MPFLHGLIDDGYFKFEDAAIDGADTGSITDLSSAVILPDIVGRLIRTWI